MLHLGTKLYATLKLFPSSGVYKLFFHSTFQANMFLEVWGFFILLFSSGNGNELNDFLWTSVALDKLHKDPKHSLWAKFCHNYHWVLLPWCSGLQHLPNVYSWKPQKSKYCLISVSGISPFMSDNFVCFSCSETWGTWSACGTEWRRSAMLTWALRPVVVLKTLWLFVPEIKWNCNTTFWYHHLTYSLKASGPY